MKLKTFIPVIAVSASLVLALFFAIPHISNKILPYLLQGTELEGQKFHLNYISPWKLIGNVEVEKDGINIEIPRLEVRYSPKGLIRKQLDAITIDGLNIRYTATATQQTPSSGTTSFFPQSLPLTIEEVSVHNGRALLQGFGPQDISLRFNSSFFPESQLTGDSYLLTGVRGNLTTAENIESTIHFSIQRAEGKLNLAGNFSASLRPLAQNLFSTNATGNISGRFLGSISDDLSKLYHYSATITGHELSYITKATNISVPGNLRIFCETKGKDLTYRITSPVLLNDQVFHTETSGTLNPSTLLGSVKAEIKHNQNLLKVKMRHEGGEHFTATVSSKELSFDDIQVQDLNATIDATRRDGIFAAQTHLNLKKLRPAHNLLITNLKLDETIFFNDQSGLQATGEFSAQRASYSGEKVVRLSGTNVADLNKITIKGTVFPLFARNLRLPFSINHDVKTAITTGYCTLKESLLNQSKLPRFIRQQYPEDFSFSGKVAARVDFRFQDSLNARANLHFTHGTFSLGSGLEVDGVSTHLEIPDLILGRSQPSQQLSIDSITYNKIKLNKLKLFYRLENYNELFLEKSSFKWCNGRVESNSLLLSPKNNDFLITLYCDRIGFSELLGQLGIPGAEGTGSLNGRLPISYQKGQLSFDDGFLFSSPGDTGIIKFTNTDTLRQSLGDSIGETHLEYSMRAIEDFQYNWTTLSFNSMGEDLTVAMKLDGKPASPLPYAYKNGMMVRSNKGPGMQHPVNLNVNFHLPLAEILRYGTNIQSLMEKM